MTTGRPLGVLGIPESGLLATLAKFAASGANGTGIDDERRRELAAAMVADVLEAIGKARTIERTIVVSSEPIAQEIAAAAGAEVVPDPADAGHVEAALAGIARAEAEGAGSVVLLPGDCPLLDPRELDRLLTGVPERYVAIVPDRHGTGTNALVLSPRARSAPPSARAAAPATSPPPARPASPSGRGAGLARARPRHPGRRRRPDPRAGGRPGRRPAHREGAGDMSEPGPTDSCARRRPARGERGDGGRRADRRAAELEDGDVVVVSQKIVSKAEGRVRRLSSVLPARGAPPRRGARQGAGAGRADPLRADEVLRAERGVLIVETRHGFVCANAGIDSSNLPEPDTVCLLPEDPDASARRIRAEIAAAAGVTVAVIVSDSFGRAWRLGQAEVAIGCAGLAPLDDWRGVADAGGRELEATLIAIADEAAAAADLVRDKASGVPAAIVRGLDRFVSAEDGPGAAALRRPRDEDLFR